MLRQKTWLRLPHLGLQDCQLTSILPNYGDGHAALATVHVLLSCEPQSTPFQLRMMQF